ncbi:hypothetical protein [Legionella qingyii]|uniref:hypothetical protein n=1 Tax=Legionella qingyii TaxID=2184757 RepID=UPI00140413B1|nr:hypothetical protein [Legionella qingyii]
MRKIKTNDVRGEEEVSGAAEVMERSVVRKEHRSPSGLLVQRPIYFGDEEN